MALESLKKNLEIESEIIKEIALTASQYKNLENLYPYEKRENERHMLTITFNSLVEQIKIINNSLPEILNAISPFKHIEGKDEKAEALVKINYSDIKKGEVAVTINKKDRETFLKELSVSNDILRRLKRSGRVKKEEFIEFKKSGIYARISNRIFQNFANKLITKGHFNSINMSLRKANMPYLLVTYISMCFFSTLLAFFLGIIIFLILSLFDISLSFPFFVYQMKDYISLLKNSMVIILTPVIVFAGFLLYPRSEKKSIEKKINRELPFVVIHMSAIAGSGIEPTQIFKIIALSSEYPNIRKEFKKIINQVNLYGYDLLTALRNTGRETSSQKLSELFNGMASAVSGGSALPEFLDKRAESLMLEYRLEKEKHIKMSETLMDIYISIVIAAPMILTLLLVLMAVSRMDIGLSTDALSMIIVLIVSLINIVFMAVLHLKEESW